MFKFDELKSIHLEITNRCQASCPMCPRKYHGGIENKNLKLSDWTYEDFIKIFSSELFCQLETLYFCGNFGDPILNDDLIKMCRYIKQNANHITVRIHTNGGARSEKWWRDLKNSLPDNHVVIFGIDGLEDTHAIYRIGTTYENVIRNACTFINEGGIAEWVFIKFKHNEHQVDEAERRSQNLGFNRFTVKNTTRFIEDQKYNVVDKEGKTLYYLEPPTENKVVLVSKNTVLNYKQILENSEIDCYVHKTKEIYIDAYRHIFPCCYIASAPYNYRPKILTTQIDESIHQFNNDTVDQYNDLIKSFGGIDNLDATRYTVKEIINNDIWQEIWNRYWSQKKLYTCARVCGKTKENFSKPKDQFIKRVIYEK